MKIKVSEKGKVKFKISIPTRLVFNGFSVTAYAFFVKTGFCESDLGLDAKSLRKFVKGFYECRKNFGGKFDMVDVETKDGTSVKITL